jgi:hypothetical protein
MALDKDKALDYYKAIEAIREEGSRFTEWLVEWLIDNPQQEWEWEFTVERMDDTLVIRRDNGWANVHIRLPKITQEPTIEFPDPNHPAVPDPVVR